MSSKNGTTLVIGNALPHLFNLQIYGDESHLCTSPLLVQCREIPTGLSWESTTELYLVEPCTVGGGLLCLDSQQKPGVNCGDFEIRFKCAVSYSDGKFSCIVYFVTYEVILQCYSITE